MPHQVIIIHGGKTFTSYEKYIHSLKTRNVDREIFKAHPDWRNGMQDKLGDDFEVFAPRMPNSNNAVYEEWKIWFERMLPFIEDGVVFIGHSLGGNFLATYLSEVSFPKKVAGLILVAAPYPDAEALKMLCNFKECKSLKSIEGQTSQIYLVYSKDDSVVTFNQLQKYKEHLSSAQEMVFEDRGHFDQESFPELEQLIKTISKI